MSSVVTATGTRTDSLKLKVDINFMKFVKTEDEWERDVMTAGDKLLCIVDCYSQLWGPCEMLSGHFSNCFFDYGEDLGMRFVRAQSDQIAALSDYREQAQPVFLLCARAMRFEPGPLARSTAVSH